MDKNLISIILPAYNVAETVQRSIESVLAQTYSHFELIVIDDGSTDDTAEVVRSFADNKIKYVRNEQNLGLIATLNKGISLSTGTYIARIDGDDTWSDTDKLTKQVALLDAMPECVLVGTQARFSNGMQTNYPLDDQSIRSSITLKNPFIHSSVMMRASAVHNQSYDVQDYLAEDYSLWMRLGTVGTLANLPDVAVEYFVNPKGETRTKNLLQTKNSLLVVQKYGKTYPRYYLGLAIWTLKFVIRKVKGFI